MNDEQRRRHRESARNARAIVREGDIDMDWLLGDWHEAYQDILISIDEGAVNQVEVNRLRGRVDQTIIAALYATVRPDLPAGTHDERTQARMLLAETRGPSATTSHIERHEDDRVVNVDTLLSAVRKVLTVDGEGNTLAIGTAVSILEAANAEARTAHADEAPIAII